MTLSSSGPETTQKTEKTAKTHRLNRFFVPLPEPIRAFPHEATIMESSQVHQIRNVLRLNVGHHLILVDDRRQESFVAEITEAARDRVSVKLLTSHEQMERPSTPHVVLGAGLIKGQRWDWMIQKVTELGVNAIVPLESERAVVHVGTPERKQERWYRIAQSAAEQSEGLFIPHMETPVGVVGFCELVKSCQIKIILLERSVQKEGCRRERLRQLFRHHAVAKSIAFAVGPEGGWSDHEVDYLLRKGFKPASLGKRILRSETAAVALMSALAYEYDATPPS